jgi:2'-5' RNA ligase
VRTFIAVSLPADLKAKLTNVQQEFRHLSLEAAWVREAGLHITLKFLGEIEPAQVLPVTSCMMECIKGYHPFMISVGGVGVFPHESHPRVLWVGVHDEGGHLLQMQQTLEAKLSSLGFLPEDRPFTPHLTLARLKQVTHRVDLLTCVNRLRKVTVGELEVTHLDLLESQLLPSGARYLTLKVVPLATPLRECTTSREDPVA